MKPCGTCLRVFIEGNLLPCSNNGGVCPLADHQMVYSEEELIQLLKNVKIEMPRIIRDSGLLPLFSKAEVEKSRKNFQEQISLILRTRDLRRRGQ